jgi:hypothetical protein
MSTTADEADLIREWWGVQLPPEAVVLYLENYSSWSWSESLLVYQIGDSIYVQDEDSWRPVVVDQEQALAIMLDFEEIQP